MRWNEDAAITKVVYVHGTMTFCHKTTGAGCKVDVKPFRIEASEGTGGILQYAADRSRPNRNWELLDESLRIDEVY